MRQHGAVALLLAGLVAYPTLLPGALWWVGSGATSLLLTVIR